MLTIAIGLCPYRNRENARTIGQMMISNIGVVDYNVADYVLLLEGKKVGQVKGAPA